jgi:cytochrome c553
MRITCFLLLLLFLSAFGCKNNQEESKEKKVFVMAEPSEMTILMMEMYAYNEGFKQQILNGNLTTDYPERFENIHSAVLTNPSVKDSSFKAFASQFIEAQKLVFESPQEELTLHYNNAIKACISCHNVKCVGPIPRIKKLLIK